MFDRQRGHALAVKHHPQPAILSVVHAFALGEADDALDRRRNHSADLVLAAGHDDVGEALGDRQTQRDAHADAALAGDRHHAAQCGDTLVHHVHADAAA